MSALPAAAAMAPGVYPDLSIEDYHQSPGISSSGLKLIGRSPAHFVAERNKPKSRALTVGSALHAMRQHRAEFDRLFIAQPEGLDGRTKNGRAQIAELRQSGRQVLTAREYESVKGMTGALTAHPFMARLMDGALLEASVYWIDGEYNVLLRCRPDAWHRELGLIIDWKTTEDARPGAARRQILRYQYHQSAALYLDGTAARGFLWAFCEKEPPFSVGLYNASPELVEAGRALYRDQLTTYALCCATGQWDGYPTQVIDIYP